MDASKILFTPKQIKPSLDNWEIKGIFNPAAIRRDDGKILVMLRVAEQQIHKGKLSACPLIAEENKLLSQKIDKIEIKSIKDNALILKDGTCRLKTISHLRKAILNKNGFDIESIDKLPSFTGTSFEGQYGVEDPRITKIGNDYLMTYVTVSINEGVCTSLAISKDLQKWKRKGIIFREQNKDVVLFPEKINGEYVALHRPEGSIKINNPSIWVSYSKDLVYWGKEKSIIQPRKDSWESERIGAGTPPIKTKKGWLLIYHGVKKVKVKNTVKKKYANVYSAGGVLLDLKNPEKILARSPAKKPLFAPEKIYEKKGFVNNVVFPTAAVPDIDKENLLIYYGAADSITAVRKIRLKDIFKGMEYI